MSRGQAEGMGDVAAAFEFRGYVAAILDNDKQFWECAAQHDLDMIVGRSAAYAAVSAADGNGSAAVSAYVAVTYACKALEDARK